jgi:prepilin signal peptidase PulO-like enzyme (type II secretory pathway)
MLSVILGIAGIPAGLVLDALVARLAVPPEDDETGEETPEEAPSQRPAMAAETGALVVAERQDAAWLRRALIVGATAGLFALAPARYDEPSHIGLVVAYACVLVVCGATDALSYRVPNVVTYPAIVGAFVVGAVLPEARLLAVIGGGALAGGILLVPALFTGGVGMGMGDVKLAAFAGLALGLPHAAPALLFTALAGGAAALLLLLSGARRRGEPIPYAPFISLGALAVLYWRGAAFATLG